MFKWGAAINLVDQVFDCFSVPTSKRNEILRRLIYLCIADEAYDKGNQFYEDIQREWKPSIKYGFEEQSDSTRGQLIENRFDSCEEAIYSPKNPAAERFSEMIVGSIFINIASCIEIKPQTLENPSFKELVDSMNRQARFLDDLLEIFNESLKLGKASILSEEEANTNTVIHRMEEKFKQLAQEPIKWPWSWIKAPIFRRKASVFCNKLLKEEIIKMEDILRKLTPDLTFKEFEKIEKLSRLLNQFYYGFLGKEHLLGPKYKEALKALKNSKTAQRFREQ
ncbi:MAG: hypothetical protein SFU25_05960 [Candidatus Caenarcaniphilales bacterium]|nr:hypothetical protein [Candidatus Caenarcaniphilales bacterium]